MQSTTRNIAVVHLSLNRKQIKIAFFQTQCGVVTVIKWFQTLSLVVEACVHGCSTLPLGNIAQALWMWWRELKAFVIYLFVLCFNRNTNAREGVHGDRLQAFHGHSAQWGGHQWPGDQLCLWGKRWGKHSISPQHNGKYSNTPRHFYTAPQLLVTHYLKCGMGLL